MRPLSPAVRWSLAPPFHPYPHEAGGLFSVALSLRSPWADVIRHRALWSPEVPQPNRPRPPWGLNHNSIRTHRIQHNVTKISDTRKRIGFTLLSIRLQ